MPRLLKTAIFISIFWLLPVLANAQITPEQVKDFKAEIALAANSEARVKETIVYDFGATPRHGIYRNIPYKYQRQGVNYKLRLKVESVTDEKGESQKFSRSFSEGYLKLKIGDPDKTITGTKTYVINYTVGRAVNYFEDHDEFFWNVTGNEWTVPIQSASATVKLPGQTEFKDLACYTGEYGSDLSNCTKQKRLDKSAEFIAQALQESEGLTLVASFAKGVIAEPDFFQNFRYFAADNWYFFLPLAVWAALHYWWLTRGRDPKGRGTVVPFYEPPANLGPADLGTLWDEKADSKEVSATIINLAVKGYLKIKDLGDKNYEFRRLQSDNSKLDSIEKQVIEALFDSTGQKDSVDLKSLKNKFYLKLHIITNDLYAQVAKNGYFAEDPQKVKKKFIGVGGALTVIAFVIIQISNQYFSFAILIPFLLSALLFVIYGRIMPQKTVKGAITQEEIKGFRWFLSVTETERLKFHNAPEKKPEQFEKFLPYAMVLGVEKEWAKQFEGMMLSQPGWYEGQPGATFNAIYFGSIMSHMNSNMSSAFVSRPSSAGSGASGFGGGGFSGGGFGGGGGGSW